jgi:DNA ligase-1
MYYNGELLIDETYEERWKILSSICDKEILVNRIITNDLIEAENFLKKAIEEGHEGLMAKSLSSKYTPGKRGKKWFKIKPAETLDLVIVGADWGYGRRTGWLSDYYLAAYNEENNDYEIIGKTFKGLTDKEFEEITKKLLEIKIHETEHTVWVKPEIVVEIAFNEIQRSPKYKSGYALRFARIIRIREDKSPKEADTITKVKRLYEKQFKYKGLKL